MSTQRYPTKEEIIAAVDSLHEVEAVEKLKQIVSFDSLLGNENPVQLYMHEVFNAIGGLKIDRFAVDLEKIKNLPGFSPVDWSYDGKENVVAVHEPAEVPQDCRSKKGKSLILNGHIDVVPTGRETLWTQDPFSPYVKDGRLYGRGSGDMKAGVMAMILAFKALKSIGFVPASKVIFQTVVEEECTGNGTLACLERGYSADAALIPEPFDWIVTAEVGIVWCKVIVKGTPAHVLAMSSGVNAIDGAMYIVQELRKLEDKWNTEDHRAPHTDFQQYGHPLNFNLGQISGGEWTSSVPCECTFEIRAGFFPGTPLEEVRKTLVDTIDRAAKAKNLPYEVVWNGFQAEGCLMDRKSDLLKQLGDTYKQVLNKEPYR
eukprot:gene16100-19157_t